MLRSLQEYADVAVAPEYRQPLKTLEEALAVHGWPLVDKPPCCGAETEVRGFLGSTYVAECRTCGRFVADVSMPMPSERGSAMILLDPEKVDLDTERRWIAGRRETKE
jgi:hypothetical protein